MDTDLTAANLAFFAREFLLCKAEDVNFHTMPANYNDGVGGFSYVTVTVSDWLKMVNDCLNPYDQDVTESNVNILTRGADGKLYATSGSIAGGEDSFLTMAEYMASIGLSSGSSSSGQESGSGSDTGAAESAPPQPEETPDASPAPDGGPADPSGGTVPSEGAAPDTAPET